MGSQTSNKSYSYDQVNRLSSMSGSGGNCTGLRWSFDVWGNRTAQTETGGTCNHSALTYDVHNRITNPGYSYDAAGNLVADGTHTYAYDAENRLTTVDGGSTATYVYDAMGNRVQKTAGSSTANYLYDLDGNITTDLLPSGSDAADYIFAGGQLVAEYASGTTYFIHTNHLGTPSVITNLSGASIDCNSMYPYGEQDNTICTTTNSIWDKFTGYRLDPETGLEYAHARYYNPSLGRFMSPDPLGGDSGIPQSLNRYAYVLNNPLSFIDPTGMFILNNSLNPDDLRFWFFASFGDMLWLGEFLGGRDISGLTGQAREPGAPPSNQTGPCASIMGTGGVLFAPGSNGSVKLQFNASGNLSGVGVLLTDDSRADTGSAVVYPNTYFGANVSSDGTLAVGFSNAIRLNGALGGTLGAYFQSATYANGKFTQVNGAVATLGIPWGSSSSPSDTLRNYANHNGTALAVAGRLQDILDFTSKNVPCAHFFGGG